MYIFFNSITVLKLYSLITTSSDYIVISDLSSLHIYNNNAAASGISTNINIIIENTATINFRVHTFHKDIIWSNIPTKIYLFFVDFTMKTSQKSLLLKSNHCTSLSSPITNNENW